MKNRFVSFIILLIILINTLLIGYMIKNNELDFLEINNRVSTVLVNNEYINDIIPNNFKITDNFSPEKYEDFLDIYFTILSSGMDEFTFYCSDEYNDCIEDLKTITKNDVLLSMMNNFVHVFNTFKKISTSYSENGKIIISIEKIYTPEMIDKIEQKIDEIYPTIVNENRSIRENIKAIHDYIIKNTKYNKEFIHDNSDVPSNTAYGLLFYNLGICSGYSDLTSLFLHKLNVPNYKISNTLHMWNYVFVDDQWLHLDVTWDDPVSEDNVDRLFNDYFLITTEQLIKNDNKQSTNLGDHIYNNEMFDK